jgi:ATP-dependent DNA helicase PIF1
LRELLAGDVVRLADRIARLGDNLRGTRPYWQSRRRELLAMIKMLKSPHLFVTASAADVQWNDLHIHMPNKVPSNATEHERIKICNLNLNQNPAIAAWYFQKRWDLFFKCILKPKFKIKDWWFRFEWQFRGSSHVHAFFWLEDAPDVESLNLDDPQSVQTFIEYWDPKVSAWNPSTDEPKPSHHPSAKHPLTMNYNLRELAQLANCVQRHTKCTSYCLRRPKGAAKDAPLVCRFHYPQALSEFTTIQLDENFKYPRFYPKRNDELLNQHNIVFLLGWQANIDFTPITSVQAVMTYIAKYCSKTEKKSENYSVIFNSILTSLDSDNHATVVFQKLLGKLIVERDWSAQECMHLLLGCELFHSSRQFKSLNVSQQCLNAFEDLDPLMDDNTPTVTKLNWIDRYEHRAPDLESVTLLQIFRQYKWVNNGFVLMPRTKPRVVNVWPQYLPDKSDPAMYENWCRAKLQLHHPYRNIDDLQRLNDDDIGWSAAYELCVAQCATHDNDPLPTVEDLNNEDQDEEEFEESEEEEGERIIRDWHDLASRGPRTEPDPFSRLGKRDIDIEYDWHGGFINMDDLRHCESYLETQKRQIDVFDEIPNVDIANLVDNQQRIFNRVIDHYSRTLAGENLPPFRINVDGTAGTGKSYLIDAITKALNGLAQEHGQKSPILRVAPTGIAAFNIRGATLHQALSLPTRGFSKLTSQQLLLLQGRLKPIKYVILDEKSMVGRRLLSRVDHRLREAFPERQNEYFGGCCLLMLGDFGQLPPVGDIPLFDLQIRDGSSEAVLEANKGRDAYMSLSESITLNRIMRQQGEDMATRQFREVLEHLRQNEITDADVEFLNTRVLSDLPIQEQALFADALRLCPTNTMVDEINLSRLVTSNKPVLTVSAQHTGTGAAKASEDYAEGLQPKLLLMEGAKVMLTRNLWTGFGLTNGTMGVIGIDLYGTSDIYFREDPLCTESATTY